MAKGPVLEYFPEEFLELDREVGRHPKLVQELTRHTGQVGFEERVAFIAAYCDIPVHESFTPEGIRMFCDMLTMALRGKRTGLAVHTDEHHRSIH